MSVSEIATLKIFSLNSMEFVTFDRNLQHFLGFLGLCPRPHPGSVPVRTPLVTEPTLLLSPPKQIPDYSVAGNDKGTECLHDIKLTV